MDNDYISTSKCRKTKRARNVEKISKFDIVERCGSHSQSALYPITKVDELFGINQPIKVDYAHKSGIDIIELLESECISKETHFIRYNNDYRTFYKMPIIRHVKNDANFMNAPNTNHWFSYNKKTYNPDFLYDLNDDGTSLKIKKICNIHIDEPHFNNDKIQKIYCKNRDSWIHTFDYYNFIIGNYRQKIYPNHEKIPTVFNFHGEYYLTHLYIFGDDIQYSIYPSYDNEYSCSMKHRIKIVDNQNNVPYTKKFELYYKYKNEWFFANKFDGVSDIFKGNLISLEHCYNTKDGLLCSEIKIVPLECHISFGYRISFYGTNTNKCNNANEYVEYSVEKTNNRNGYHDGVYDKIIKHNYRDLSMKYPCDNGSMLNRKKTKQENCEFERLRYNNHNQNYE
ncbi:hypothetical protein BMW23_1084 [Bodo saltans virus]|uniref:Uncharacterized protein n=1 Tax=Bodo saltans virus TaxID=2024608 RepID=A0A2H4UW09_9VIRU|nr:hypothetical protein QJ851_gp1065 [Bodo saltans virus]ATZ81128.1 hypothetical protein BMW23_1084 [Bodo saltans virus]